MKVTHFVGKAVRGVIGGRQWPINHVALGPLRPHSPRLDGDDFDIPFGQELFLEGFAEPFERWKARSAVWFLVDSRQPKRTELARRVVSKGGVPDESTNGRDVDDTTGRGLVFAEVLHSL